MTLRLAVLALAGLVLAAPAEKELVRDEAYNFRILGEMPRGWSRKDPRKLVFTFAIDGIPHAYVHFSRERLRGELDVEEQVRKRAEHYRFPGVPDGVEDKIRRTTWGGLPAVRYEHEAEVKGVLSVRRVTALYAKGIWYELIETIHGEHTEDEVRCALGLNVFRQGFRLLVPPGDVPRGVEAATIESRPFGFRLRKPQGFTRLPVDTGQDPGCRVAFERPGRPPHGFIRFRLFEYGLRDQVEPTKWLDVFFTSFASRYEDVARKGIDAPSIRGAKRVTAEDFTGVREKRRVRTRVLLIEANGGRVFALRIWTREGAEAEFEDEIREVLESLDVGS